MYHGPHQQSLDQVSWLQLFSCPDPGQHWEAQDSERELLAGLCTTGRNVPGPQWLNGTKSTLCDFNQVDVSGWQAGCYGLHVSGGGEQSGRRGSQGSGAEMVGTFRRWGSAGGP